MNIDSKYKGFVSALCARNKKNINGYLIKNGKKEKIVKLFPPIM